MKGPRYKNWALILRDARNDAAHNKPIPTDYLLAATFGMKTISKLFDDKTNFEQLMSYMNPLTIPERT